MQIKVVNTGELLHRHWDHRLSGIELPGMVMMTNYERRVLGSFILEHEVEYILEFGTWHGFTTGYMADLIPETGRIWTVDISSEYLKAQSQSLENTHMVEPGQSHEVLPREAIGEYVRSRKPEVQKKVEQIICDSKKLDLSRIDVPYLDLILIDGNHALDYVESDFALSWPKLKPGGLVFFHDIILPGPATFLIRHVHEFDFVILEGTQFAVLKNDHTLKRRTCE